jgi:hypothetical protein
MWRRVTGREVAVVSKDPSAFAQSTGFSDPADPEKRYFEKTATTRPTTWRYIPGRLHSPTARSSERTLLHTVVYGTSAANCLFHLECHCLIFCRRKGQSHVHMRMRVHSSDKQQSSHQVSFLYIITLMCGGTKRYSNYYAATIHVKAVRRGLPHRF